MTVATVTVEEAAAWLQSGEAVLIDVREADEFQEVLALLPDERSRLASLIRNALYAEPG